MPLRIRKLIGTVLLLVLIAVYALVVMVFASTWLPKGGRWIELAFYMVAGLAWVPPAAWIVSWMHRT